MEEDIEPHRTSDSSECNVTDKTHPSCSTTEEATCKDCTMYKESHKSDYNTQNDTTTKNIEDCNKNTRLSTELKCNSAKSKKARKYLPHFKARVVGFALKHSIKKAVDMFQVGKDSISSWVRETKQHKEPKKNEMTACMFQHDVGPDDVFIQWLKETDKSCMLSRDELISKVTLLIQQFCHKEQSKKNTWFYLYSKRLLEDDKTIIKYPQAFKQELVSYTKNFSKSVISKVFSVDRKRLFEWLDEFNNGKSCKRNVLNYVPDAKVDQAVWEWYSNQKEKPTGKEIRLKAGQLYREAGYPEMKCSAGWYYRWRGRHGLPPARSVGLARDSELLDWLLRQLEQNRVISGRELLTQASSFLPSRHQASQQWVARFLKKHLPLIQPGLRCLPLSPAHSADLNNLLSLVQSFVAENNLTPKDIIAFDELPLNFIQPEFFKKELSLGKTGWENCQGSVIISCNADGSIFPTCLIFKEWLEGVEENSCNGVRPVFVQSEGINDKFTIEKWLDHFLTYFDGPAVIICDSYDPHFHLKHLISERAKDLKIELVIIPPGCSLCLQPILFGISDKFKEKLHSLYEEWLHGRQTPGLVSIPLPSDREVFTWVCKAHYNLQSFGKNLIQEAFHAVGFIT